MLAAASSFTLNGAPFQGPVRTPHLFEIVELTNLGAEDVDDNIAGVDQNPIARRQTFDARHTPPRLFQAPDDPVSDRSDVDAGASCRYDHRVGDARFSMQVDDRDVLGLRIVETRGDDLYERQVCGLPRARQRRESRFGRSTNCCIDQFFDP
jgi:hypothetical protein